MTGRRRAAALALAVLLAAAGAQAAEETGFGQVTKGENGGYRFSFRGVCFGDSREEVQAKDPDPGKGVRYVFGDGGLEAVRLEPAAAGEDQAQPEQEYAAVQEALCAAYGEPAADVKEAARYPQGVRQGLHAWEDTAEQQEWDAWEYWEHQGTHAGGLAGPEGVNPLPPRDPVTEIVGEDQWEIPLEDGGVLVIEHVLYITRTEWFGDSATHIVLFFPVNTEKEGG